MEVKQAPTVALSNVFSGALVTELQNYCKEKYGRNIEEAEAQEICLKVALFIFLKERRHRHDIPTI